MPGGLGGFLQDVLGTGNDYQFNVQGPSQFAYTDPNRERNRQMLLQGAQDQQGMSRDVLAPQIDQRAQQGIAAQQAGLANTLAQTAAGQGQSVAQQQLLSGLNRAEAQQTAQAASMGAGVNPFLAQRQLASQAAAQRQDTLANAALLRAQETATAQGQLGQVLAQNRGQTMDASNTLAQMQQAAQAQNQQAALSQQQINNQASQYATSGALGLDASQFQANMAREQGRVAADQQNALGNSGIAAANQANANALSGAAMGAVAAAVPMLGAPIAADLANTALKKKQAAAGAA